MGAVKKITEKNSPSERQNTMKSEQSFSTDNDISLENLRAHFEEAARSLRGAALGQFQRNAKQVFCQACYEGDIEKIMYFLDGLPTYFDWLSRDCLNDYKGISWACFGKQFDVIQLLALRQGPDVFLGFDFDVALEVLHQARDEHAPLQHIAFDEWHGRSTVEAVHKVAVRENDRRLIVSIADVIEENLDRLFEQIGVSG